MGGQPAPPAPPWDVSVDVDHFWPATTQSAELTDRVPPGGRPPMMWPTQADVSLSARPRTWPNSWASVSVRTQSTPFPCRSQMSILALATVFPGASSVNVVRPQLPEARVEVPAWWVTLTGMPPLPPADMLGQ